MRGRGGHKIVILQLCVCVWRGGGGHKIVIPQLSVHKRRYPGALANGLLPVKGGKQWYNYSRTSMARTPLEL